jgi:hypothetical protein
VGALGDRRETWPGAMRIRPKASLTRQFVRRSVAPETRLGVLVHCPVDEESGETDGHVDVDAAWA